MTTIRLTTVTITLLLSAIAASAETRMEASIPFDFQVGKKVLPAGDYQLVIETNGVVRMGLENGSEGMLMMTDAASQNRGAREQGSVLRFRRYGSRAFLAEIWQGGSDNGRALNPTRTEYEAARTVGTFEVATVVGR